MMRIAGLDHRISLCTMHDVVEEVAGSGVMSLRREAIAEQWAQIVAKAGSFFTREGQAIEPGRETRQVRTHQIVMRYRADLNVSGSAWVYERRRKSSPRWYKVLGVSDNGLYFTLDVRLVERSDLAPTPVAPVASPDAQTLRAVEKPDWVKL